MSQAAGESPGTFERKEIAETIDVLYECMGCGHKGSVAVSGRESGEDVVDWVNRVARIVQFDHSFKQPYCGECKVDLKIPLSKYDPDGWIGKAPSK